MLFVFDRGYDVIVCDERRVVEPSVIIIDRTDGPKSTIAQTSHEDNLANKKSILIYDTQEGYMIFRDLENYL